MYYILHGCGCFSHFLSCTNSTNSRKTSYILSVQPLLITPVHQFSEGLLIMSNLIKQFCL